MKTRLVLDADIAVFRASARVEQEVNWGNDNWTVIADMGEAKQMLLQYLDDLTSRLELAPDEFEWLFTFTGKQNFRKRVYEDYKGNRKETRKPTCYNALKEWVRDHYPSMQIEGLEADDIMGIIGSQTSRKYHNIIVSQDKDLRTIPCNFWNPDKMKEPEQIDPVEADRWWLTQALTGDVTDGYKGCPTYGPKKAEKALAGLTELEDMVAVCIDAFLSQGLTEEDFIKQAQLARILRNEDFNKRTNTVNLWINTTTTQPLSLDSL